VRPLLSIEEWIEIEIAMRPRLTPERRRRVVNILLSTTLGSVEP